MFDRVSSEYGWSDDQILDTPVRRLRQISAAIAERLDFKALVAESHVEWQTKVLASYVAAIAPSGKGAKKLLAHVDALSMRPRPEKDPEEKAKELPDTRAVMVAFGGKLEAEE